MALSKIQMEQFSNTISFESCMEYGLEKVKKPMSIDLVRGIIAGPNMKYKCIELDQSFCVFHVMQQNLISVCENTSRPLLFMEACTQDNFDGLLTVTLKPKTEIKAAHCFMGVYSHDFGYSSIHRFCPCI